MRGKTLETQRGSLRYLGRLQEGGRHGAAPISNMEVTATAKETTLKACEEEHGIGNRVGYYRMRCICAIKALWRTFLDVH